MLSTTVPARLINPPPPASSKAQKTKTMEKCIVFYSSPGMGHLASMVELAKRFLPYSFHLIVIVAEPPFNTGSTAAYINRVAHTHPTIAFHHLPPVSLPLDASPSPHHEALAFRFLQLNGPHLFSALQAISRSFTVCSLILDFFCAPSSVAVASLDIPSYFYFSSAATCLAVFLHLPALHNSTTASFKDLRTNLHVPGVPPLPPSHMPLPILDREDEAYDGFLLISAHLAKSRGILVNTFQSLEPRALIALSEGACIPDGPTPPVYAIGPIIATQSSDGKAECLAWLDSQPPRSVVFLCFGSLGLFTAEQLRQVAVGLEKSGHRFLWVVRSPPAGDDPTSGRVSTPPEPDLDALLPEGFLSRTRERGMVVKSWAPQAAVLSHESVGGFVTHCGWNSVLEALGAGVPMVAWPLYAEQKMNMLFLVEEAGLAMPIEADGSGFVEAAEVEKRVRTLMESDDGRSLRERTLAVRDSAAAATGEGGASGIALSELAELFKHGCASSSG